MKRIKVNERSKVLIAQYGGIILLLASGYLWAIHWIMGVVSATYGVWVTAQGYKLFKDFLLKKWKD